MKLIEGVKVKKLNIIPDDRGFLMEILRNDDDIFVKFGQVYVTTAYPGVIKAWHAHRFQKDNIVCLKGMIKLCIYDDRDGSPTKGLINEFFIGENNPSLIHIPELLWHGFKNICNEVCYVINIPTNTYNYENPDELRRPAHNDIPYNWERKSV